MSNTRKIILRSSDGETFEVDEAVALESQTIKHMIEVDCADNEIPLPNVTSKILSKVFEYCKKRVETPKSDDRMSSVDDDLKAWDAEFVKVDQATLFDLILAADYLNIRSLLDLTIQTVADMIKCKTPQELREFFFIENDSTPEEEEEIRKEHPWAFDSEESFNESDFTPEEDDEERLNIMCDNAPDFSLWFARLVAPVGNGRFFEDLVL